MKTKLTQFFIYINNIDRRYMQYAYFAFMLAMFILRVPEDGSGGTR
ncbi:MAG: hypothetical protein ABI904_10195 [Chloroflexota bacterium]